MAEAEKHGRSTAASRARLVLMWAGLFALALALRVFRLDEQSLFWDDYNGLVGLAEPGFVDSILAARDVNPEGMPLYHIVQYLFRGLIGDSPLAMRGLSVALGLATLPFVYLAAAAVFGRGAGGLAALLFAVSPQHIYHDQSIRNYPLAVMLATASMWILIRAERGGGRRLFAANLLINTALFWTQLMGLFAVAAQGTALFLAAPCKVRRWGFWGMCQGALLAPAILWILAMPEVPEWGYWHFRAPTFWQTVREILAPDYLPMSLEIRPEGPVWGAALGLFATDSPLVMASLAWPHLLAGAAGVLIWACVLARRAAGKPPEGAKGPASGGVLVLLAVAVVPAAALALVSHVWRPMYYPRYFLYSGPALYALIGGVWVFPPLRRWRGLFLAVLALACGHQLCMLLPGTTRTPWIEAGRRVLAQTRPGDLVLVGGYEHGEDNLGLLAANMPSTPLRTATAHSVDAAVLKAAAALCAQPPSETTVVPSDGSVFYVTALRWGITELRGLREGWEAFGLEVSSETIPGGESLGLFRITRPEGGVTPPFGESCERYWLSIPDPARTVSGEDLGAILDHAGISEDREKNLRLMRLAHDDGHLPESWGDQTFLFAYLLVQEGAWGLSRSFLEAFIAETGQPADLLRTAYDAIHAFREGTPEEAEDRINVFQETARTKYWENRRIRWIANLAGAAMLGTLGRTEAALRLLEEARADGGDALREFPAVALLAQGELDQARREMERFRSTVPGSRDNALFRLLGLGPWNAPGAAAALCDVQSVP